MASGRRSISLYPSSLPLHLWVFPWVLSDFYLLKQRTKIIREAVYSILFFVTISGLLASFLLYTFAEPLATFGFKDPEATYFIQAGSFLILLNVIESVSLFYFRVFRQIKKFSYLTLFETFGKLFFILVLLKMGYGLLGVIAATLLVQGRHFFNRSSDHHITDRICYSSIYLYKRVSSIFSTANPQCAYKMGYGIK